MTEASKQALAILRDPTQFKWYVIPIFVIVAYIYSNEIQKRDWNVVLGGLAFYGMDVFNEIWNSLVFHFTGYSAVWTAPGSTAFLLLIGLNIEITLMFLILGMCFLKTLPKDKNTKILGVPNRPFLIVANSIACVFIEVLLNRAGALVWDYSWWNFPNVWLIVLFGYMPFMTAAFLVYDMEKIRNKLITVGVIFGVDISAILIFGVGLRWI
jgi:hypothetical protein